MQITVQHPVYGEIVYSEGSFTGKRTITVNGTVAKRVSKKEYLLGETKVTLKGNSVSGIELQIGDELVQLSPKPVWYEIVLAIIPLLFLLTWGNSVSLCAIFPVIGGAIGGALGGVSFVLSLVYMKKQKSPQAKLLIGLACAAVTILLAYLLAILLIKTMA